MAKKPIKHKKLKRRLTETEPSTIEIMEPGETGTNWGPFAGGEVVVTRADGSAERFESEAEYAAKYEEI